MKNIRIFAALIGAAAVAPHVGFAAYPAGAYYAPPQPMQYQPPVYQQYQQPVYQQYQQPVYQQYQPQYQQPQQVRREGYIPAAQIGQYPQAAAPGRVTGQLPKVGNAYVNAGRKYYQPEGFDRLADSGLYIGLSLGYTYSISGGMLAQYQNEKHSWFVPGAFKEAHFQYGTVMPIQISVGAAINNDVRVDFAYLRYSGMSYPSIVQTASDDRGSLISADVSNGRVSGTATMLNVYYNLDSYTGVLASGSLRPYVGVGLGISTNTISDYVVYDGSFYGEEGIYDGQTYPAGLLTGISEVYAYHSGGTTEQMAYAFEGGLTTEMQGGLKVDFYVRWAHLGQVESSGSIVVSQTEWLSTGLYPIGINGSEVQGDYDSVYHYTDWKESGTLNMVDLGVRLRIQF